ncbi:MAG: mug [Actinomycetia bacterium]|nr:mug [Actinomycetes bacterium]
MERETVAVYEHGADVYVARGRPRAHAASEAFAARVPAGALRADLGCGPGYEGPHLGEPLVSLDAARAMLVRAGGLRIQADLADLPLRDGCLHGAWARRSYQHLPHEQLPAALADLHRVTAVGTPIELSLFAGEGSGHTGTEDDLPGRLFAHWSPERITDVLVGAGFEVLEVDLGTEPEWPHLIVRARRARTLADHVGPGMRLLLCGLNPSLYSADVGVNFARPGNRFWPAALGAGLATVDRDPRRLLRDHRIGMTDLVKRASVAADELTRDEYAAGVARLERLCAWLRPGALYLVGYAGWRAAVDRKAAPGWQPERLGGVPVYLGPSTSGLNASTQLPGHIAHLRAALEG